jgi:hypothetical protein
MRANSALFSLVAAGMFFGVCSRAIASGQPMFFRGLNLNGPPVKIDGHLWEGEDAQWYRCQDRAFENQNVILLKETDAARASMIRSSRWGGNQVELLDVPQGDYSVFLYLWEDNNPETFSLFLNGREVAKNYNSGPQGHWERLGPWLAHVTNGTIRLTSRGGAANFSGIEIWKGDYRERSSAKLTPENLAFFESRIRPLLIKHCYECHSVDAETVEGGLLVDSRSALQRGGGRGPVIIPGDPNHSLLIEAVRYGNEDLAMPPEGKLGNAEIADLEKWVAIGAPDPRTAPTLLIREEMDLERAKHFWSLNPVSHPRPPDVQHPDWPANELDHFILAAIEGHGLKPAPPADKQTLIRRATFDLTGLPPTPEEIDAFLADSSAGAFSRVIERLLSSPQYGERWGRHWMDVIRYADSAGDNSDFPIPQMYRYRNWIIDAFNRDLPYDQFIREQLAGDLLGGETIEKARKRIIATGYLANSRRFGSRVDDYPQHLTIEDTIDNLGRAFLATTLNCSRCHNHKFDPITQEDYYALYGIFHSTRYPWPGIELEQKQRDLVPLAPADEVARALDVRRKQQAQFDAAVKLLDQQRKAAQGDKQKDLEKQWKQAKERAKKNAKTPLPFEQAYAVAEGSRIEDCAVQIKGDPTKLGPIVHRRFPKMLGGMSLPEDDQSSGRLALANWIADPGNPLTARVIVNRIWLYHFGQGLVPTPNDFGRQGKAPTHPELLDWLARRFIDSGWSIKELHRHIMLSRTYQQSSQRSPVSQDKDPANIWLSAFPRCRLDAESIRDSLLVLGGHLDGSPGGPHPFPPQTDWKFTQHNPFKAVYETNRRSVYLMTQRIQRHPYLAIFDGADPSASTPQRLTSTTPLQALYLLNDPFVHEQAQGFAKQLIARKPNDEERIQLAYRMAFGRMPAGDEQAVGMGFIAEVREALQQAGIPIQDLDLQIWQAYCRSLFRLNEFVYID